MGLFARIFGGKERGVSLVENAGPGVAIPTKINAIVSIPRDMPIDDLVKRRNRLLEVIPQLKHRAPVLRRKLAAKYAAALNGDHGSQAREAAHWLLRDAERRQEQQLAEHESRLRLYEETIAARTAPGAN